MQQLLDVKPGASCHSDLLMTDYTMRTSYDEALSATDEVTAVDLLSGARSRQH